MEQGAGWQQLEGQPAASPARVSSRAAAAAISTARASAVAITASSSRSTGSTAGAGVVGCMVSGGPQAAHSASRWAE
jgi:hypothetical protein